MKPYTTSEIAEEEVSQTVANFNEFDWQQITKLTKGAIELILALNPEAELTVEVVHEVISCAAGVVPGACFPYYDNDKPCRECGRCNREKCLYEEVIQ